ncbi:cupredoxin domain-containing protein [Deinococcus sp.]|uniref:cupredoxin domain-containing protein n=1 Tax=Deinococcus sp. TaxID=47478 RepID=UPI0028699C68|nr:cupredoxin domain-containing protein [Deinococcus sp.]
MNKRMIVGTLSALALLAVAMPSHAQDTAPAKPTDITMKLAEWTMGMDMTPMKAKGAVMFNVENAGKYPHALAIEGKIGGKDFEISTAVLKPGEKTTLMVTLPAGTYTVYCPVGKHEAQGMKADLVIE